MSFSTDWNGFTANDAVTRVENGSLSVATDPKEWQARWSQSLKRAQMGIDARTGAYANRDWVDYAPQMSAQFLAALDGKPMGPQNIPANVAPPINSYTQPQ